MTIVSNFDTSESVDNPDSTFTPVPATITPAGLELDPDTPANLDYNNKTT